MLWLQKPWSWWWHVAAVFIYVIKVPFCRPFFRAVMVMVTQRFNVESENLILITFSKIRSRKRKKKKNLQVTIHTPSSSSSSLFVIIMYIYNNILEPLSSSLSFWWGLDAKKNEEGKLGNEDRPTSLGTWPLLCLRVPRTRAFPFLGLPTYVAVKLHSHSRPCSWWHKPPFRFICVRLLVPPAAARDLINALLQGVMCSRKCEEEGQWVSDSSSPQAQMLLTWTFFFEPEGRLAELVVYCSSQRIQKIEK